MKIDFNELEKEMARQGHSRSEFIDLASRLYFFADPPVVVIDEDDDDVEIKEVSAEEMLDRLKEAGVPKEVRDMLDFMLKKDESCCVPDDCDGSCHPVEDNVNHPRHYQSDTGIECIDAIRAALGLEGFVSHCRGTAIKYAWRSGDKDEKAFSEDLRKGAWYLTRAANELEKSRES